MLVLSRRLNERIVLPAVRTAIQVVAIKSSGLVRLGVDAPPEVAVVREELLPKEEASAPPSPLRRVQALRARLEALTTEMAAVRRQLRDELSRLLAADRR